MHALLDLQLTRELAAESGLSEADYDVLSSLSETPGRRCRLSELAARLLWSTSRLSHQITRMGQRGLVEREECPSDGRGSFVVLTAHGFDVLERAAPGHVASVRRHFIDLMTPEQIDAVAAVSRTVIDHLNRQRER
jgi:DNA-binding MarR family transcriptional regulator